MKKPLLITTLLLAAAAAGLSASLTVFAPAEPYAAEAGTILDEPRPLPEFALPTPGGEFSRASLRGKWSLVFFGFTNCPDVCPNTLFMLDKVVSDFSGDQPPQVVFISVDAQRDDPQTSAEYAEYFNPDFIGVSGQGAALNRLTSSMMVAYGFEPHEDGDGYDVTHSSAVILVDPQARMHTIFVPPLHADAIRRDLQHIMEPG